MSCPIPNRSSSSCAFSVIIPTHNHGQLLEFALRSVQRQSLQDFEIIIIGDGITAEGRACVSHFMESEPRLRFFDFPKGPRLGEAYRHKLILEEARGQNICYLCDDDMLFPSCLEVMQHWLQRYDFVHPLPVFINEQGEYGVASGFLGLDVVRQRLVADSSYNFIGLSGTCHTRSMYQRLPYGWRTSPQGIATDHYMWQQILAQTWCTAYTHPRPLTLHFPDKPRKAWSVAERIAELTRWEALLLAPDGEIQIATKAITYLLQVATEQAERLRPNQR